MFIWLSHYSENDVQSNAFEWSYAHSSIEEDLGSGDTHGCGMNPVITLKNGVLTNKGDGSKDSPFEIFI